MKSIFSVYLYFSENGSKKFPGDNSAPLPQLLGSCPWSQMEPRLVGAPGAGWSSIPAADVLAPILLPASTQTHPGVFH